MAKRALLNLFPDRVVQADIPSILGCRGWCLFWDGKPDEYGQVEYKGRLWRTHRLSFFLAHGRINHKLPVCHQCDRPGCCQPAHLFQASQQANMLDRRKWSAFMPPQAVDDIRTFDKRFSDAFLASRYNVPLSVIRGIRWRKVAA